MAQPTDGSRPPTSPLFSMPPFPSWCWLRSLVELTLFGLQALDGPVALIFSAVVAAIVALKNGHPWSEIGATGGRAIAPVTSAIFIVLAVGALIGIWNRAGTIPTLVY